MRLLPNSAFERTVIHRGFVCGQAMTESQAADWAAAMLRRSDEGTFFGASNYYGYVATKR